MNTQDSEPSVVLILTTWPDTAGAESFAKHLVEQKLAACINILPPMTSIYSWKGILETGTEHQLVIKTTEENVKAIASKLESTHPYELAEMLCLPVKAGGTQYLNWIKEITHVD